MHSFSFKSTHIENVFRDFSIFYLCVQDASARFIDTTAVVQVGEPGSDRIGSVRTNLVH